MRFAGDTQPRCWTCYGTGGGYPMLEGGEVCGPFEECPACDGTGIDTPEAPEELGE